MEQDPENQTSKIHPTCISRSLGIRIHRRRMDSIGLTNLVGYDAEGLPDDVKYEKMVLSLTEMMKMHHQMIARQEKEIIELKATIRILSSSNGQ